MTTAVTEPCIHRVGPMASGGTVAYEVRLGDRRIGWVGNERPWRGSRHGALKWWCAWREEGDTAARWRGDGYRTRADALAVLLAVVNS